VSDQLPLIQIVRRPPDPSAAPSQAAPDAAQFPAVIERLRQYGAARARPAADEQCEFCGAEIASEHGHLVDLPRRALLCVCRPCYLLFAHDGAGGARFRAVPTRYATLPAFSAAHQDWEALDVPIGLAFFFRNSTTGRVTAFYPSPAGATESELSLDAWEAVARAVPEVATLVPDVEALLVRRRDGGPEGAGHDGGPERPARYDALIVPIDACYELVGRIRRAWRGFQGGDDVWREIDDFFARAAERAFAWR
jgi:hypothetical protein